MEDLTTGSINRHLLKTTSFMLVTMVFQTLYFLVDLYWVGRLGKEAVAGVGVAGNLTFVVLALSQMLGVGTTTVVSHAAGRKEHDRAVLLFNQSQVLSLLSGLAFLLVMMAVRLPYARALGADQATAALAAVKAKDAPLAVGCYNDDVALAVVAAGRALGLRIPDDLSVVGVDATAIGQLVSPRLTTIGIHNAPLMERIAAELAALTGAESPTPLPPALPEVTVVPGETA